MSETIPDKPRNRGGAPRGNRNATRHGVNALKAKVMVRGLQAIDMRTAAARALIEWRGALIADLGGEGAVSAAQRALVDLATRTRLYVDSLDAWIMERESLVHWRKKAVLPVLRERTQIADSLARYLGMLGLERRAREVPTLAAYLNAPQRPAVEPEPAPAAPTIPEPEVAAPAATGEAAQ